MSKTWYPIIDYVKCTGCKVCYNKCSHGVYELDKDEFPKVVNPEGCVHLCTGCGSICPSEAIEYFGDSKSKDDGCGCSCCCDSEKEEDICCDSGKDDESCCGSDEKNGGCCCSDSCC